MSLSSNQKSSILSSSSTPSNDLEPRLVLRVGFAGNSKLSTLEEASLKTTLKSIFQILGNELTAIAPYNSGKNRSNISKFFSDKDPLLRLMTGLCKGADIVAGDALKEINHALGPKSFHSELAAILPFDAEIYRQTYTYTDKSFGDKFDEQIARCAWVQELDGIYDDYDKPGHSESDSSPIEDNDRKVLAKRRRCRAYRAQGAFLLRHSDLLIAATKLDQGNKAGGTMGTARDAIAFGIPVIFINIGENNNNIYLIDPDNLNQPLDSVLEEPAPGPDEFKSQLITLVNQLTVGFDRPRDFSNDNKYKYDVDLLREYFNPEEKTNECGKWSFRKKFWRIFKSFFPSKPFPKSDSACKPFKPDQVHEPFRPYRKRARDLNYHYSDLYRGAFLSNYMMAIMAVSLAAVSLLFLTKVIAMEEQLLYGLLLALGMLKLIIVGCILRNTKKVNSKNWNKKAIDFRYFLERLRSMYYLPLAGSYQPPEAVSFASRSIQQSSIDWLFNALVRAISPADVMMSGAVETISKSDGSDEKIPIKKLITISAEKVVEEVKEYWIDEQIKYHEGNAGAMRNMNKFIENSSFILTIMVIVVVFFDLILVSGEYFHLLSEAWKACAEAATRGLITVTVILPAVIAALSGIRSQTECQRLAERSEAMKTILKKHDDVLTGKILKRIQDNNSKKVKDKIDVGSQVLDSLFLTEHVATRLSQEVSEWTVLYAKEVNEPG